MTNTKNITVIGLNNRGCKLIKFLRKINVGSKINGYDLNFDKFKNAVKKGLLDNKNFTNLNEIVINSDIIVLNIPLNKYEVVLQKISSFVGKECLITDINSSKSYVYENKTGILNIRKQNFIQSNCLFSFENLNETSGKKVLINSEFNSKLEFIRKLSAFWKNGGFDTDNLPVKRNDVIIGHVLHLPFIISLLFKKEIKNDTDNVWKKEVKPFFAVNEYSDYIFDDIFYHKDHVLKSLQKFINSMVDMRSKDKLYNIIREKAIKACNKKNKIFDFYKIENEPMDIENNLTSLINFSLETVFVSDFISPEHLFYLNLDFLKLSPSHNKNFEFIDFIGKRETGFLKAWNSLIEAFGDFVELLESENLTTERMRENLTITPATNTDA